MCCWRIIYYLFRLEKYLWLSLDDVIYRLCVCARARSSPDELVQSNGCGVRLCVCISLDTKRFRLFRSQFVVSLTFETIRFDSQNIRKVYFTHCFHSLPWRKCVENVNCEFLHKINNDQYVGGRERARRFAVCTHRQRSFLFWVRSILCVAFFFLFLAIRFILNSNRMIYICDRRMAVAFSESQKGKIYILYGDWMGGERTIFESEAVPIRIFCKKKKIKRREKYNRNCAWTHDHLTR